MARYLSLCVTAWLVVLTFASDGWGQFRTDTHGGHPVVAGEVLVKFRAGATAAAPLVAAHIADADYADAVGGAGLYRFRSRSRNVAALLQDLALHPEIALVEPNYIVHSTAAPNDPLFASLWGLQNTGQVIGGVAGVPGADIGAVPAWGVTTGSRVNVVAVIDTGVDYTHPDLAANIWSAPTAFTVVIGGVTIVCPAGSHGFNAVANTCDPRDDNDHGTHVSGTIGAGGNNAAGVAGVNWTASIMAAKFLDATGSGTTAGAINAIEFAIQAKAAFAATAGANVRVLSASWGGGGFSQALLDEINRANTNGMLFVAAAGNGAANNDPGGFYPADYNAPNVIAVAATTDTDALASFSNYGPQTVHLGAPGVSILSTVRASNGSYASFSGTSMATPHVSGAAALLLSRCALTTPSLKAILLNNVTPLASLAGRTISGGRLNVNQALSACTNPAPPDFTLAMSPSLSTVSIGGSTIYTVAVSPSGTFTGAVSLTASGLPAGASASFNPATVNGSGSSTLTVSTQATVAAGTYTLRVTGTSGSLSRTASATLVALAPSADLMISTTAGATSVTLGSSVTFTLTVANNGLTGATGVVVTDTLPVGLSFVSVSTTQGACTSAATITCNVGALAKNASARVTLVTRTTATGIIRNTASVRATELDPNPANNASTAAITVSPVAIADLTLTLSGSGATVPVNGTYTYAITVRNAGPNAATGVTVSDAAPAGMRWTYVQWSQGTCAASTPSLITCSVPTLASGASVQISIRAVALTKVTVTDTATVSAIESDPNPGNNSASVTTRIN